MHGVLHHQAFNFLETFSWQRNTYKSYRYASQLKNIKYNATATDIYIHNFFTFLHLPQAQLVFMNIHSHISEFHTGELKGPAGPTFFCRAHFVLWHIGPIFSKVPWLRGSMVPCSLVMYAVVQRLHGSMFSSLYGSKILWF